MVSKVLINQIKIIVSNTTFLASSFGSFPGIMVDTYLGYSASQVGNLLELKENRM